MRDDRQGRLKALDETRAEGFYVVLTRPDDVELRSKIDDALRKGIRDGALERIYRKYGIWTADGNDSKRSPGIPIGSARSPLRRRAD